MQVQWFCSNKGYKGPWFEWHHKKYNDKRQAMKGTVKYTAEIDQDMIILCGITMTQGFEITQRSINVMKTMPSLDFNSWWDQKSRVATLAAMETARAEESTAGLDEAHPLPEHETQPEAEENSQDDRSDSDDQTFCNRIVNGNDDWLEVPTDESGSDPDADPQAQRKFLRRQ